MRLGTYYRAALLRALGLGNSGGRVLDVGGYDGFWLSALHAESRVSVDLDTAPSFAGIEYLRGDGQRLPFADGCFDSVFALDVLEHVDDEQAFVRELVRVLRPGGRLVLTTPHEDIRIFPSVLTPWANRRWQHHRVPGYSPEGLDALLSVLRPQQLRIRQLRTWSFRQWYLPLSLVWRLVRAPARPIVRWVAAWDSRAREGSDGYLLAELVK